MTEPDDRELDRYLKGDSPVSRAYRAASRETPPSELDEAILAQARAESRKKPNWNRALTPIALAASVLLGVNLAWNVYQHEPVTTSEDQAGIKELAGAIERRQELQSASPAVSGGQETQASPAEPEAAKQKSAPPAAASSKPALADGESDAPVARDELPAPAASTQEFASSPPESRTDRAALASRSKAEQLESSQGKAAAPEKVLDEHQKIELLINYIEQLPNGRFIRNGSEHSPAEAASHLRLKLKKAGDQVRTAEDFIQLCASRSSLSSEPYTIRFSDGQIRTTEDVLRKQLKTLEAHQVQK